MQKARPADLQDCSTQGWDHVPYKGYDRTEFWIDRDTILGPIVSFENSSTFVGLEGWTRVLLLESKVYSSAYIRPVFQVR